MTTIGPDLMVVAGEASGDLHAAHVMERLRADVPGIRFVGLGGERMKRVGMRSVGDSQEIGVVGLFEVLRILPRAKQYFDDLVDLARETRPQAALLVDAPDFNLRLARKLSELDIPVVYYVSPQLWAWRKGRVNKMRGIVDKMMVLFPFEVDFYREAGIPVAHVGHPLLDVVPPVEQAEADKSSASSGDWIVGLLPGSRNSEIKRNLSGMLEAAARIGSAAGTSTRLILAGTVSKTLVASIIASSPLAGSVEVVDASKDEDRFRQLRECRLCLCASGTATLEVGLLEIPLVVSYRLAPLTHAIARRLVKLEHVSLVNLVLGRGAVPELIQEQAEPKGMSSVALDLLVDGAKRQRMLADLKELRPALGSRGASKRAAKEVAAMLGASASTAQ